MKTLQKTQKSQETDHGQTELNNILVKKKLNEINKVGTFTQGF